MNDPRPRKKDWVLTQAAFDRLLRLLDPDVERAAEMYEQIRRGLILFFQSRGSLSAEDHTDETLDRGARRISEGVEIYTSSPFLYFYGIALRVLQEHQRKPAPALPPPAPADHDEMEQRLECMEGCLQELDAETRAMLGEYCQGEFRAKLEHRRRMAERMGVSLNTLRIRVHRIREQLEKCVKKCVERSEAAKTF